MFGIIYIYIYISITKLENINYAELVLLWESSGRAGSMEIGDGERAQFSSGEPSDGAWTSTSANHQCHHQSDSQVPHWLR